MSTYTEIPIRLLLGVLPVSLGLFGCGSVPEPTSQRASAAESPGETAGYVHRFTGSRFAIGGSTVKKTEFGMEKEVGPWGVFARILDTDMTEAIPNADAPTRSKPPLAGGASAQTSAVRAYFLGDGLPAGQLLDASAMAEMSAAGAGNTNPDPSAASLDRYYAMLHRQVGGIPVVDSFAWASIDVDGDVVSESVYWPTLPSSVSTSASDFKAHLADPKWNAAFLARLPGQGRLVIHHTSGVWHGTFHAAAAYDVPSPGGMRTLHFDERGVAFLLPEEVPTPGASSTPKP